MDNLMDYRLNNAKEKLESAKLLLDAGKYRDSIGRSYYVIDLENHKNKTIKPV